MLKTKEFNKLEVGDYFFWADTLILPELEPKLFIKDGVDTYIDRVGGRFQCGDVGIEHLTTNTLVVQIHTR